MKIFIRTYSDGRKAYGTGLIANSINNQLPVTIEEAEVDDKLGWEFLDNPDAYTFLIQNGQGIITRK